MERLSFDLDSEALMTRSEMLLPMLMEEYLKTTADGTEVDDRGRFEDYCR
jgi:hypothetical protein